MRTAFGYIRVSTDEQADRGLGLDAQRQRVRAYGSVWAAPS
jgi:DNA invertase Pin-like site-specific DNA recombinase